MYRLPVAFLTFFIILVLLFGSCRKNDATTAKAETSEKVLAYLDGRKRLTTRPGAAQANANIDALKKNLDLAAAHTEILDKKLNLLIVPVKDEAIEAFRLDGSASLILMLMTDKTGKIKSASVVYFQPADGQKRLTLPDNTLRHLLSGEPVETDGTYKMVAETGKWLSQFQIKNHKLFAVGTVTQKNGGPNDAHTADAGCQDWYLVTTYYYSDGTTSRDEVYLGTTCPGDGCSDPNFASICDMGDLGGGTDGGVQPDQPVNDEDQAGSEEDETPPSANLNGDLDANATRIRINWQAYVPFTYLSPSGEMILVEPQKPFPVPVSQIFTDDNGHPATLACQTGSWWSSVTPLTFKSRYVNWSFIGIYNYTFSTGFLPLWKNRYMSKVISAP